MEVTVASNTSILQQKGRLTVPASIRRALGLNPGDRIVFYREGGRAYLETPQHIVRRTAGIAQPYARNPPPTVEELRAAFEKGVADEVVESMNRE